MKKKGQRTARSLPSRLRSATEERIRRIVDFKHAPVILGAAYLVLACAIAFPYHRVLDFGVESDFLFEYVPIAKKIAEGSLPIGEYRGPVFPLILAAIKPITGDYFSSGLVISLLSGALTLALTFVLVRGLFKPLVAASVALLMIANAYFFMYTYQLGTDMIFCALSTASVCLLLVSDEFKWWRLTISAVFASLAYLTRYNGVFLLVIPMLILLLNPWKIDIRRRIVSAAVFAALFLSCITPWGLYCLREKGRFFYNENRLNIAFDVYGRTQMSREQFLFKGNPFEKMSLLDLVKYDPPVFLGTLARNFLWHGLATVYDLLGWLVGIGALVGLVLLVRRKPSVRVGFYLLLNFVFFFLLLPIHYETRYPLFMLGGLMSLAASGLLLSNVTIGDRTFLACGALTMLLVLLSGWNSYRINREQIGAGPKEVVEVANWLKNTIPLEKRGKTVAARKPHLAFYAGLDYVPLPLTDSPEELIRKLHEMKVDYLYFGRAEYSFRPQLRALIDTRRVWPGLKIIEVSNSPLSVLYEVE